VKMFRILIVFCFSLLANNVAQAESETAVSNTLTEAQSFKIRGWHEVVVSVRNIDNYATFFTNVAQWQSIDSGNVSRRQLKAWGLPRHANARYHLYANPGTERGHIRLVEFFGVEQTYNRLDSQAWDTGGIYNINMRVKDLDSAATQMRALGWQAKAPVTQFSFGSFEVKEWIVRSPDGFQIALIERIKPELTGWPHMKGASRTFNSTQIVKDIKATLAFYESVLGFQRYLEHRGASPKAGPHVLGMPHNYADKIEREVYIVHPDKTNEGSVEILQFHGFDGVDYSEQAHFPNLGIGLLRFPVSNISALHAHFKDSDVTLIHDLRLIDGIKRMVIRSPEGAWLEFYEESPQQ